MKELRTELIKSIDKKFLRQWDKKWASSSFAHFFNSPKWFLASLSAFKIKDFVIFVVKRREEIMAVLPLIYDRHYGIPVLRSPGGKFLDRSTLLITRDDKQVVKTLIKATSSFGNLYLSEVEEALIKLFPSRNSELLILPSSSSPYIPRVQDFFKFLSKKNRSKIESILQRNEKDLGFHHITHVGTEHLKTAFNIDSQSTKAERGCETFSDTRARELFTNLAKYAPENLVLDILYWRTKPIVFSLGVVYRNTFHAIQTAYLGSFKKIIPGKILLYLLLKKLEQEGFENFDFSRGENDLKKEFTPYLRLQYDLFYSGNPLIRIWLNFCNLLKRFILGQKDIYTALSILRKPLHIFPVSS